MNDIKYVWSDGTPCNGPVTIHPIFTGQWDVPICAFHLLSQQKLVETNSKNKDWVSIDDIITLKPE